LLQAYARPLQLQTCNNAEWTRHLGQSPRHTLTNAIHNHSEDYELVLNTPPWKKAQSKEKQPVH
jgi:hypothetical protein